MTGFRATIVVHDPAACPVADVSARTENPVESVSRSSQAVDGRVVEELAVAADASIDGDDSELTPVQSNDREAIYRFERDGDPDCVCEIIERTGTPVSSARGQNGSLLLSVRTLELATVAEIVDELRTYFDGVVVEELTQDHDGVSGEPVVVDLETLTDRQREILETAHELGYFDYPKDANATDVAEELGVARSTFSEHLAAAQTKLLGALLEE